MKCTTDLTPPGCSFRSLPRARRGCGLAVIVRESFPVTIRQKAGEEGGWGGGRGGNDRGGRGGGVVETKGHVMELSMPDCPK